MFSTDTAEPRVAVEPKATRSQRLLHHAWPLPAGWLNICNCHQWEVPSLLIRFHVDGKPWQSCKAESVIHAIFTLLIRAHCTVVEGYDIVHSGEEVDENTLRCRQWWLCQLRQAMCCDHV